MSQMSQGDAAKQAVKAILGERAKYDWKSISEADKEKIFDAMFAMYKAGMWSVKSDKRRTDEDVKKYIPGMVNNWVRKAKELNGGVKYETQKPGSRSGGGDERLQALKDLRALLKSQNLDLTEVDKEIAARQEELKPKPREIKVDALPEHLKALAMQLVGSKS